MSLAHFSSRNASPGHPYSSVSLRRTSVDSGYSYGKLTSRKFISYPGKNSKLRKIVYVTRKYRQRMQGGRIAIMTRLIKKLGIVIRRRFSSLHSAKSRSWWREPPPVGSAGGR